MRTPAVLLVGSLALLFPALVSGEQVGAPIEKLAPVVVEAGKLPLTKLELGYRLRTARFAAVAVTDGRYIYIIGGSNSGDTPLDDVERFDPGTGASEPFARLAVGRRNHRAILHRGKIYVLGGYNPNHFELADYFENSVEVIDLATRAVTKAAPMPIAKANFACAALGDKIYVMGGARSHPRTIVNTNTTEVYSLTTGKWEKGVPMPTPRMSQAVTVGDVIIVAGGYKGPKEMADVEAYIPEQKGWRVLPKLQRPVGANSMAFIDHYLFLFGGRELGVYELGKKTSDFFTASYTAQRDTATVVLGNNVYVFGGTQRNQTSDDSMAGYFIPPPKPLDIPRQEPDESSAEFAAVSMADRDRFVQSQLSIKDYLASDEIQVFALSTATSVPVSGPVKKK